MNGEDVRKIRRETQAQCAFQYPRGDKYRERNELDGIWGTLAELADEVAAFGDRIERPEARE